MKKLATIAIVGASIVLISGGLFLSTWEMPVPVKETERILANDRFPR
jgi:hypothetical protein